MSILLKIKYLLVGEPSVEAAVSNIDKAIAKLETAIDFHSVKSIAMAEAKKAAEAAEALARVEMERAARVAAKMKDLLA